MAYKDNPYSGAYWFSKLEEKAKRIRERDASLSVEQSIAKAAEENPRIAQHYADEVREDILKGK